MKKQLLKKTFLLGAFLMGAITFTSAQSSLIFNGSNTYVEITANDAYHIDSAFTVETWIKLTAANNVFSTQAWGENGGSGIDFVIDGQHFKVTLGNGDWFNLVADTVTIPYGTWTHLAAVYNGETLTLYINGTEKASGAINNYRHTAGGNIRIGDNPTWNPRIMTGQIDEVRFWSIARQASEIADNLNNSLAGTETGLIGYWDFNEASGTVATDKSATANNGTIVNCEWGEDYNESVQLYKSSLVFNGTDTYVEIAANDAYNIDSAFTVETWVKLVEGKNVFSTQAWGENGGSGIDYVIDGQHFKVTLGNGDWFNLVADTVDIPFGVWTHLAAVYNGETLILYINGLAKASGDVNNYKHTAGGNIRIGDNPTWNPRIFKGQIDEVRFWSVSRSAAEISDNLYESLTGNETGLIGYWDFNEGSGTVATDKSATSNDGTVVNCTWDKDYYITGFTDVAVTAAVSPVSGTSLTAAETLTVTVINNSNSEQTNIPISFMLDGGTVITEHIASLAPALTTNYSFEQKLDLSAEKEYTIEVFTTLENDEVAANDTLVFNVTHEHSVAIDKQVTINSVLVYPSIVADFAHISFAADCLYANIFITDVTGKEVFRMEENSLNEGAIIQIDLSRFEQGIYIISVRSANGNFSKKIMKAGK
ncbi:MAG: T9SS type A sorting domain-containing protein [Bacteroidales bacterium]|nr:T9SS type A sorting domain-containing protein [Bacteroidales bacterium]